MAIRGPSPSPQWVEYARSIQAQAGTTAGGWTQAFEYVPFLEALVLFTPPIRLHLLPADCMDRVSASYPLSSRLCPPPNMICHLLRSALWWKIQRNGRDVIP